MGTLNSYAVFDLLFIADCLLKNHIKDFSDFEVNLIGYYACLLSLYDGNPISFWGYRFLRNQEGAPISDGLIASKTILLANKELNQTKDFFYISEKGSMRLKSLENLSCFSARRSYLRAACSCMVSIPVGTFRKALFCEPLISTSTEESLSFLVDDSNASLSLLYGQFSMMKAELKGVSDIRVPAALWLRFLGGKRVNNE